MLEYVLALPCGDCRSVLVGNEELLAGNTTEDGKGSKRQMSASASTVERAASLAAVMYITCGHQQRHCCAVELSGNCFVPLAWGNCASVRLYMSLRDNSIMSR
jgi:hypothetical protein